jgi:O-antigen/teichoic acid export membrane protein
MVSSIVLARALQPEGRGIYAVVLTATELALVMTSLGANKAAVYYLARSPLGGDTIRQTAFTLGLWNGLLQTAGLAVAAWLLLVWGQADIPAAAVLAAAPLGILMALRGTWEGFLRGEQRNHEVNVVALAYSLCFAASLSVAALLGWLVDAELAIALRSPAMAVAAALALALLAHQGRRSVTLGVNWPTARALVAYGVPFTLLSLLQTMNHRFDVLLVQSFLDSRQVGYYSIATAVGELIWYLPVAVGFVLIPRTAAKGEVAAAQEAAALARWTLGLTAISAAGLAIIAAPLLLLLYGGAYLGAVDALRLLLVGIVTSTWYLVLGGFLLGQGRIRELLGATLCGLALNIVLNVMLIPRLALVGAALSSTISYTLTGVLVLAIFQVVTGLPVRDLLFPRPGEIAYQLARLRSWFSPCRAGPR